MIKEVKVTAVRQHLECDACGGEMLPTGRVYPTFPEQYPHKCNGCGNVITVYVQYPSIIFREAKDEPK